MDRDKVIKGLELCSRACRQNCPYRNDFDFNPRECIRRLTADALSLLKAQEPRVMTPEEIKPADDGGRMYWLELYPGIQCNPALMMKQREIGFIELAVLFDKGYGTVTVGRFKPREYNIFWRCWTYRPTDEQRKAVKWDAAD